MKKNIKTKNMKNGRREKKTIGQKIEIAKAAIQASEKGLSVSEIAKLSNMKPSSLHKWIKDYEDGRYRGQNPESYYVEEKSVSRVPTSQTPFGIIEKHVPDPFNVNIDLTKVEKHLEKIAFELEKIAGFLSLARDTMVDMDFSQKLQEHFTTLDNHQKQKDKN